MTDIKKAASDGGLIDATEPIVANDGRQVKRGKVEDATEDTKPQPQTYKTVLLDKRLPHGAFRLWHLLRDYLGKKMFCWPSIRMLSEQLGSSPTQISKWRDELREHGYIQVKLGGPRRATKYTFQNLTMTVSSTQRSHFRQRSDDGSVNRSNPNQLSQSNSTHLKKKKSLRDSDEISEAVTDNKNVQPFTEIELQRHCEKKGYDSEVNEIYVRAWLATNDENGWHKVRFWKRALRCYVERCHKNAYSRKNRDSDSSSRGRGDIPDLNGPTPNQQKQMDEMNRQAEIERTLK